MKQVQVNFPEELVHHLRMKEIEFGYEIKKMTFLKLYELGKISSGKAADMLGISKIGFLELLNQYEISIFNDDEEEYLGKDLENGLSVGKYKGTKTISVSVEATAKKFNPKNNMSDKVISNTTPLITLLSIGKFELLKELYDKIYIPQAVFEEIEQGKHKPFYTDLKQLSWIEIKTVTNQSALRILSSILDRGEAEAIILYEEMNADLLIIDEKLGREQAKTQNCKIIGSLGILVNAKQVGLIEQLKPLLVKARANGIHISDKLFNSILEKVGE